MATILVIDDDELVSRTLQRALKMYEHQVMTASSGIEGLQLARRHRPDLFILDIMMPGVDGYQVCRQIRGDPLLKELPVLFHLIEQLQYQWILVVNILKSVWQIFINKPQE